MTEIFTWEPHQLETPKASVSFSTLVSTMETGTTQRRSSWARQINSFTWKMDMALIDPSTLYKIQDEILEFFIARKGMYDGFYLPSWKYEARLATAEKELEAAIDRIIGAE